ncbi:MAG: GntR family transcriptional regulator [Chloroflexi bacterium]|nr:GntR family transcriptional regulator [Chloroflexota bacterium]
MTTSYVPRYRTIEQSLRERISTLRPGDLLPSDAELCAEFGVSRMTARGAMQRLADEGLVTRIPGRGSFVAEPSTHRRADRLLSFSREMRRQGRVPTSRIVTREIRPANAADAAALDVREGDPVVLLQRVRCADGLPVALETAVLERRTAAAVMAADLAEGSLHAALVAAGHVLRRGRATISAASASDADARLLGAAPGAPMLVERRVILDDAGRPLESTESRYPADRYALDVWFDVDESGG